MPPRKKQTKESFEQRSYIQYNPSDIKHAVEVKTIQKPPLEVIERIEKIGTDLKKPVKKEKTEKVIKKSNINKKTVSKNKTPARFIETKLNDKGHTLIITEKPQAAAKIAAALSGGRDKKINNQGIAYYEFEKNNKKIIVACAVGHLFTISQTKRTNDYPVFDIAWFPNFEVKKKDFTKKYYQTISKLSKNASEIIVATDFDTEGEVIGYNIVRFIAGQKDAKRMKFSSLTSKELNDSYDNALSSIEWGQAIAGETRHFLDWLYGINLSRALMNSIKTTGKFKIMSIGRVQGPALNLIVEKEKEILKFIPTPYWQVFIVISDGKNKIEIKYIKDIIKKQELDKFKDLVGKKAIANTIKSKQIIPPPAPFDLTTLQTEAYKFYGITPSQTLATAQKLYLAGLISYPRTSSQKIPDSIDSKNILKQLSKHFKKQTDNVTRTKPIEGKKSDPAHPAISPTGIFNKLDEYESKIYELIVKRFISCFCSDAELENKRIEVIINNLKFTEKGMEIISPGWMNVYPVKMEEKELSDINGEVDIEKLRSIEKMTQPPRRFSPASIISELEKRNLGTKATRSNILDTLYDRDYIKDKSIRATALGIRLIDTLKKYSPVIIDEKLTREIEKDMDIIRDSKKDLVKKQDKTIDLAKEALNIISKDFKSKEIAIGKELVAANTAHWEEEKENNKLGYNCPSCKDGDLGIKFSPRFKSYFVACSNYPDCKQTFSLPGKSLIKKAEKNCEECNYPMVIALRKGKRPWLLCFNKTCPGKKPIDINGDVIEKKER
jgi:DNA topoisomerase I